MKKLALAAALLATVTGAQAYQVEVQGGSEFLDSTVNSKDFSGSVAGTYYFKAVDPSKGPLAEAAFINQASSVSVAYQYQPITVDNAGASFVDSEVHSYGVKGEAYYATPIAPVYASANYTHNRFDSKNNNFPIDGNSDSWGVEVGVLPINNFLIAVGYSQIPDDLFEDSVGSINVFGLSQLGLIPAAYQTATIGETNDVITARTKYVGAIDGTNMSVGFEAGYVKAEESQYGLKTDLYLTPKFSVGGFFADSSVNNTNEDAIYGGNVNYFVTDAIAVGATYAQYNAIEGVRIDSQTYGLNVKARF